MTAGCFQGMIIHNIFFRINIINYILAQKLYIHPTKTVPQKLELWSLYSSRKDFGIAFFSQMLF